MAAFATMSIFTGNVLVSSFYHCCQCIHVCRVLGLAGCPGLRSVWGITSDPAVEGEVPLEELSTHRVCTPIQTHVKIPNITTVDLVIFARF